MNHLPGGCELFDPRLIRLVFQGSVPVRGSPSQSMLLGWSCLYIHQVTFPNQNTSDRDL